MHYYTSPLRPGVSEFRSIRGTDSGREPSAITKSLQRQPWSIVDDRWSLHEWNQILLLDTFFRCRSITPLLHSIFHPFSSGFFFFAIFRHRKLSDEFMLRGAAVATFRDPSGNAKACVMGIGWNLVEISCSMILDTKRDPFGHHALAATFHLADASKC